MQELLLIILLFLTCWAVVHGGTRQKQPTVIYDDDHDVSGLIDED